jgi:hypothetical protein
LTDAFPSGSSDAIVERSTLLHKIATRFNSDRDRDSGGIGCEEH